MWSRITRLIGQDGLEKLIGKSVLIVGIGGVGGYVAEMLARCGIGRVGIMDFDVVDISNINRQIIALNSNIGECKTDVMKARILDINPDCEVVAINSRFNADSASVLDSGWDYVVDAIDSFEEKVALICLAKEKGLNIVSAMGAGNRIKPCTFEITDIYKTSYDALAKKLRKTLREKGITKLDVCYTKEPVLSVSQGVGSVSYVVAECGIKTAGFVIDRLLSQ